MQSAARPLQQQTLREFQPVRGARRRKQAFQHVPSAGQQWRCAAENTARSGAAQCTRTALGQRGWGRSEWLFFPASSGRRKIPINLRIIFLLGRLAKLFFPKFRLTLVPLQDRKLNPRRLFLHSPLLFLFLRFL